MLLLYDQYVFYNFFFYLFMIIQIVYIYIIEFALLFSESINHCRDTILFLIT